MGNTVRQKQEALDYQTVLSSAQGMRLMRRIMGLSGVFGPSYAGENTHGSAFNEGRRSIGLYLLSQTAAYAPDKLAEMIEGKPDPRNSALLSVNTVTKRHNNTSRQADSVASDNTTPLAD